MRFLFILNWEKVFAGFDKYHTLWYTYPDKNNAGGESDDGRGS